MAEVHVFLRGGLGNQLFQFSAGLSLSKKLNIPLTIDMSTGFKRDKVYKRNFQLKGIANEKQTTNFILYKRIFRRKLFLRKLYEFCNNSIIVTDGDFKSYINHKNKTSYILDDYFQSELYFLNVKDDLALRFKQLINSTPIQNIELPEKYISVGIRFYEETINPNKYSRSGNILNAKSFLTSVLKDLQPDEKALVFTYKPMPSLKEFYQNKKIKFIFGNTHDLTDFETMLIFAKGERLYFNNSTYYWWAAWLSEKIYSKDSKNIHVYDDFINPKTVLDRWTSI